MHRAPSQHLNTVLHVGWDANSQVEDSHARWVVTVVMWATVLPVAALGYLASSFRLHWIQHTLLSRFK